MIEYCVLSFWGKGGWRRVWADWNGAGVGVAGRVWIGIRVGFGVGLGRSGRVLHRFVVRRFVVRIGRFPASDSGWVMLERGLGPFLEKGWVNI